MRGHDRFPHARSVQPQRPPGRPRDEQVGRAVIDATIALLAHADPAASLSVEDVAAHAGVGRASIYRRWPSKEDLISAALSSVEEQPLPDPPGRTVPDDLRLVCASLRRSARDCTAGRILPSVAMLARRRPGLMERYIELVAGGRRRLVHGIVARGVAGGELRADIDVDATARLVVWAALTMSVWPSQPALTEAFVELVLRGLVRNDAPVRDAVAALPREGEQR